MSLRAGIVVTGTEVLQGIIRDSNGPWLAERLRELGVDAAQIVIVGDRPEDLRHALRFLADEGVALIVTSGGLGPTADDLTADVVAQFQGRAMGLDEALFARIAEILETAAVALARSRPRGRPALEPQAGARARRGDRAGAGRDRARAGRAAFFGG